MINLKIDKNINTIQKFYSRSMVNTRMCCQSNSTSHIFNTIYELYAPNSRQVIFSFVSFPIINALNESYK